MSTNSWLKELRIAAICVGGPLVIVPLLMYLNILYIQLRYGPFSTTHTFQVTNPPEVMTKEFALAFAGRALVEDGYDVSTWEPVDRPPPDPKKPPEENPLPAIQLEPQKAWITFLQKETKKQRSVWVEIQDKTVQVQIKKGKRE